MNSTYKTKENYLTILVCLLVGFLPVKSAILLITRSIIVLPYSMDVILLEGIYNLIILLELNRIFSRIRIDSLFVLLFFAVLWSLSFLLNAEYAGFYFKIGYQLFLGSIPCYILARCVKDYALLKKYLNITSIFIALATLVLIDRLRTNTLDDFNYSQKIGYFVLPAAIISVSVLYEK